MSKPGFLKSALEGASGLWQKRARHPGFPDVDDADPERQGQALFRRGRHRMRAGEIESALEDFERAIELLPDFAEAVASHAECLDMLGRAAPAQPEYEKARQLWAGERAGAPDRCYSVPPAGPADLRGRVLRAGAEAHQDRLLSPLGERQCAAGAGPGRGSAALLRPGRSSSRRRIPRILALKGEALSMLGRYRQAVDAFSSSLRANPEGARDAERPGDRLRRDGPARQGERRLAPASLPCCPRCSRPRAPAWRCAWPTMRRRCPSSSAPSRRRRPTLTGGCTG